MKDKEITRQGNVRNSILNKLRQAGTVGATNVELSKIGVRYGGALGDLYKRGYKIDKEHLGEGLYNYILVEEPEKEITDHVSALDLLKEGVDKIGLVDSKELVWLLDELGINVRRKSNTYKKGVLA